MDQLKHIRTVQPDMWADFLMLGEIQPRARELFNRSQTIQEIEERFKQEDNQITIFDLLGE